jgi:hypothetical protein
MESLIILALSLVVFLLVILATTYILKSVVWAIRGPFLFLNWLQWVTYNPLRFIFRDYNSPWGHRVFKFLLFTLISPLYWVVVHIAFTPIRFVNAVYFDLLLFWPIMIGDSVADIIHPKIGRYRFEDGAKYIFHWVYAFPYRLLNATGKTILAIVEGLVMTGMDTVWPTITMYHGTAFKDAAVAIAQKGEWYVGPGDYAGSGIYFGLRYEVAKHYASTQDSAIVLARVTLSFCMNSAILPKHLRGKIGFDGKGLADGLGFFWKSVEHWRSDRRWFEYCIIQPGKSGKKVKTWRARPIAILKEGRPQRIWGGLSLWSGGFGGFIVITLTWLFIFLVLQLIQ